MEPQSEDSEDTVGDESHIGFPSSTVVVLVTDGRTNAQGLGVGRRLRLGAMCGRISNAGNGSTLVVRTWHNRLAKS
jgi:hypothetical protein